MTKFYLAIFLLSILLLTSCVKEIKNNDSVDSKNRVNEYALVIHGGAGNIYKGRYTEEQEKLYIDKLSEALNLGKEILASGGTSVDAVETVIRVLEDSPLFNAGKGAVLTSDGDVELDASIMNGKDISAGGVASLRHIKNPITLARFVMEHSTHVLLFGEGAEKFADEFGMQKVENNYFKTEERIEEYNNSKSVASIENKDYKFGTVGCVAIDKNGNLAAGTSTGGMAGKKFGRVGDAPIIGAGTYANNKTCALSATGHGEFFIRNVVTYDISALMEYSKFTLKEAADHVIKNKLVKQNAKGGIIGIDKKGNIVMSFNTDGMFRGYITKDSEPTVELYN
ncbi:MAG: isoaspartyl peptidase/L-asparaginase [Ignavibacteriales bacterium]|nr:isoaspartyl peptidase/L-asparaginase [Ignavibacteriales bacterium]